MAISWKTYYFKLVTKRVNTNMNEEILVIPIPITCYLKADLMGVFYLLVISILFLQFSENYSNRLEMRFVSMDCRGISLATLLDMIENW